MCWKAPICLHFLSFPFRKFLRILEGRRRDIRGTYALSSPQEHTHSLYFYCWTLSAIKNGFSWPQPGDWPDGQKIAFAALGCFLLPSAAKAIKMAMAVGRLCKSVKNSCAAAIFYSIPFSTLITDVESSSHHSKRPICPFNGRKDNNGTKPKILSRHWRLSAASPFRS